MIRSIHNYVCTPIVVESSRIEKVAILCIQPAHFIMAAFSSASVSKMSYLEGKCIKPVNDWVIQYQDRMHSVAKITRVAGIVLLGIPALSLALIGFTLHSMALKFNPHVQAAYQQLIEFKKHRFLFNALAGNYENAKGLLENFPPNRDIGEIFGSHRETTEAISDPETFNTHFESIQKLLHDTFSICQLRYAKIDWNRMTKPIYLKDSMNVIFTILRACPEDRIEELLGPTWSKDALRFMLLDVYFDRSESIKPILEKLPQNIVEEGLSELTIQQLKILFERIKEQDALEIFDELYEKGADSLLKVLQKRVKYSSQLSPSNGRFQLPALSRFLSFDVVNQRLTSEQRSAISEFLIERVDMPAMEDQISKLLLLTDTYSSAIRLNPVNLVEFMDNPELVNFALKNEIQVIFEVLGNTFLESIFRRSQGKNSCLDDCLSEQAGTIEIMILRQITEQCLELGREDLARHFFVETPGSETMSRTSLSRILKSGWDFEHNGDIIRNIIMMTSEDQFDLVLNFVDIVRSNLEEGARLDKPKLILDGIELLKMLIRHCPSKGFGKLVKRLKSANMIELLAIPTVFEKTPQLFLSIHEINNKQLNNYFFHKSRLLDLLIKENRLDIFGFFFSDLFPSVLARMEQIESMKNVFAQNEVLSEEEDKESVENLTRMIYLGDFMNAYPKLINLNFRDLILTINQVSFLKEMNFNNFELGVFSKLVRMHVVSLILKKPFEVRKVLVQPSEKDGKTPLHYNNILKYFQGQLSTLGIDLAELMDGNGISPLDYSIRLNKKWVRKNKSRLLIEAIPHDEYSARALRLKIDVLSMWDSFTFGIQIGQINPVHLIVDNVAIYANSARLNLIRICDGINIRNATTGTPPAHDPEELYGFYAEMLFKFERILVKLAEKNDPTLAAGILVEISVKGEVCPGGWREVIDEKYEGLGCAEVQIENAFSFESAACHALRKLVDSTLEEVENVHQISHYKFAAGLISVPDPQFKLLEDYGERLMSARKKIQNNLKKRIPAFIENFASKVQWDDVLDFLKNSEPKLEHVIGNSHHPIVGKYVRAIYVKIYEICKKNEARLIKNLYKCFTLFFQIEEDLVQDLYNLICRSGAVTLPKIKEGEDLLGKVKAEEQKILNKMTRFVTIDYDAFVEAKKLESELTSTVELDLTALIEAIENNRLIPYLKSHFILVTPQFVNDLKRFVESVKKRMTSTQNFVESVKKITKDPQVFVNLVTVQREFHKALIEMIPRIIRRYRYSEPSLLHVEEEIELQFDPYKFRFPSEYVDDVYRSWSFQLFTRHKNRGYTEILKRMHVFQ